MPRKLDPVMRGFNKAHQCRKLGILDAGATPGEKGWLRSKFEELDIIKFEHLIDTTEEYGTLDAVEGTPA